MKRTKQIINYFSVSALALCASMFALPSVAEEATLTLNDGGLTFTGEMLEITETEFVIQTNLGTLRVARASVVCDGPGCSGAQAMQSEVVMSGSEMIGNEILPLILDGYATQRGAALEVPADKGTGIRSFDLVGDNGFGDTLETFRVMSSISSDAFTNLRNASVEIGMSERRISPTEARAIRDTGSSSMIDPKNEHFLAIDSVLFVVNQDNPVNQLSLEQIRGIFVGDITNWSQVGGPDEDIRLVQRPARSTLGSFVRGIVLNEGDREIDRQRDTFSADQDVAEEINNDSAAIGYVSFAHQRGTKALSISTSCGITYEADDFSARTEEYPLHRFLYLYTRDDNISASAQDFLTYAASPEVEPLLSKSGFIDLGIRQLEQRFEDNRAQLLLNTEVDTFVAGVMRDMLGTIREYDRLSSTFRFRTGSSELNPRGQLNLQRLANFLEAAPAGSEVLFVGFTDEVGAFSANQTLAQNRADSVIQQLQAIAGDRVSHVNIASTGFGEISPVACNTSDAGRANNRRVEVWIKS